MTDLSVEEQCLVYILVLNKIKSTLSQEVFFLFWQNIVSFQIIACLLGGGVCHVNRVNEITYLVMNADCVTVLRLIEFLETITNL